jgi:hypothetical protein
VFPFRSARAVKMVDFFAENYKMRLNDFRIMLKTDTSLKTHSPLKPVTLQKN